MRLLVIGAHGKVGKHIIEEAVTNNIDVLAMVRSIAQKQEMEEMSCEVVVADLEGDFEHVFNQVDTVIFTAGSGSHTGHDKTISVDQQGAIRSVEYALKYGIKHYIMISAQGARTPNADSPIQHYFKAKYVADEFLKESGVPFTILRPGRLNDESEVIGVQLSEYFENKGTSNRKCLAQLSIACLNKEKFINRIVEVFDGDSSIEESIQSFK